MTPIQALRATMDQLKILIPTSLYEGRVMATFASDGALWGTGHIHQDGTADSGPGTPIVQDRLLALSAFMKRNTSVRLALNALLPNGFSVQLHPHALVICAMDGTPQDACRLPGGDPTDLPEALAALQALSSGMLPGTQVELLGTSTAHQRLQVLQQVPDLDGLVNFLLTGGYWYEPPLTLYRFQDIALLMADFGHVAWLAA